jgi:hypothetical protein
MTARHAAGGAFLVGAIVAAVAGGWWLWPLLTAAGLYLLIGHVRLRAATSFAR